LVICENCKEEVPETLFCLRCGYPLYVNTQAEEGSSGWVPPEPIE
jgi:rRNA maturation endonuclease Nob1